MSLNGGVLTTCEKEGFLPLGDQSDVVFFLLFSAGAMLSKKTTTTTTTTTKKSHLKTQNPHKLHFFWGPVISAKGASAIYYSQGV